LGKKKGFEGMQKEERERIKSGRKFKIARAAKEQDDQLLI